MDKKLAITAITLVAVTMGIAAISPAVFAQEPPRDPGCEEIKRIGLVLENIGRSGNIPDSALSHIADASEHVGLAEKVICE